MDYLDSTEAGHVDRPDAPRALVVDERDVDGNADRGPEVLGVRSGNDHHRVAIPVDRRRERRSGPDPRDRRR